MVVERSSWWVWSAEAVAFMELKVDGWENIVLRCSIGSYSTLERGCQHGVVVKENDGALGTGTHQHLEKLPMHHRSCC
jgi:hypothetical protein